MGQGRANAAVRPGGARFKSAFGRLKNRAGGATTVFGRTEANARRTVANRRARGLNAAGTRRRPTPRAR